MFCSTKYLTDKTEVKTYQALEKGVLLRALFLTLDMSIALRDLVSKCRVLLWDGHRTEQMRNQQISVSIRSPDAVNRT